MAKHKSKNEIVCPLCGKIYYDAPAQSRRDKRSICPDCGLKEAMEDSGMNDAQKEEILNEIRKNRKGDKNNKK